MFPPFVTLRFRDNQTIMTPNVVFPTVTPSIAIELFPHAAVFWAKKKKGRLLSGISGQGLQLYSKPRLHCSRLVFCRNIGSEIHSVGVLTLLGILLFAAAAAGGRLGVTKTDA